ncbi:MAG TPA: PhnA-like protein [Devosiaceae bacterium]|nr:PhnA-like protein [Devosiaceae bacterium]
MADRVETARPSEFSPATPAEDARTVLLNRVSWGAIFAGAVIALIIQFLLSLLGVGIGAATLRPASGGNPDATTFSVISVIWYAITGLISAFTGGIVAGRLSGKPVADVGALHGLTSWALTTIVLLYLLTTTIGGLVGGALSGLGSVASGLGGTVATAAQTAVAGRDPFAAIQQQITQATGGSDPAALRDAAVAAVRAAVTGDQAQADQATNTAAQALARAQNIPIDDARNRVQQYTQQYQQAVANTRDQALRAAEVAAGTTSRAALAAFLILVISAAAAWFGGRLGTVAPILTGEPRPRRI